MELGDDERLRTTLAPPYWLNYSGRRWNFNVALSRFQFKFKTKRLELYLVTLHSSFLVFHANFLKSFSRFQWHPLNYIESTLHGWGGDDTQQQYVRKESFVREGDGTEVVQTHMEQTG